MSLFLTRVSETCNQVLQDCSETCNQVQQILRNLTIKDEIKVFSKSKQLKFKKAFKIQIVAGHRFESCGFNRPARCGLCKGFLYIFDKRCKLCHLTIHRSCNHKLVNECTRSESIIDRPNAPSLTSNHNFEKLPLIKPTFCDHCGYLVLFSQEALICKIEQEGCGLIVHESCKENICFDCDRNFFQHRTPVKNEIEPIKQPQQLKICPTKLDEKKGISLDQFRKFGLLGKGSYGEVHLVRWNGNSKLYAMKIVHMKSNDSESHHLEWQILDLGRNFPFLASGSCCFVTEQHLIYVMEYCQGLNLLDYLDKVISFGEDGLRFYSAEIILALEYLHKHNIIHRDLKLENVILDSEGHCRLIDFGMACRLKPADEMKTNTMCGTQSYLSPEMIRRQAYSIPVDWWALGIVMYELSFGHLPFDFEDVLKEDDIYRIILETKIEYPRSGSRNVTSLLDGLLRKEPEERFGCREVKAHSFFNAKLDGQNFWKNIIEKAIRPPFVPDPLNDLVWKTELNENWRDSDDLSARSNYDNFSQRADSFKEVDDNGYKNDLLIDFI